MFFASNTKVLVAAGLVSMALVACGRGGGVSQTQEAWNAFNDPTGLGIGPTAYEQVPRKGAWPRTASSGAAMVGRRSKAGSRTAGC